MPKPRSLDRPFWLLLLGIVLILLSNNLLTEGMFLDGVTYAGISRNMAEGHGTFWNPHYTQTLFPEFRQHPPLALGMEALAFKVFGDHLWVEKFYSLLCFLISGLLITLIWKRTTRDARRAWLPLLFWVAIPLVSWSALSNLLENTMSIFVLLSVYIMIIRYQRDEIIWLFLAGLALLLAFLTKGFTGLFPLIFPFLYCIIGQKGNWKKGIVESILLLTTLGILTGAMFLIFPVSMHYLHDYIIEQVIGGGLHQVTTNSRFFIVFQLLTQSILPLILLSVLFVLRKALRMSAPLFEHAQDKTWFTVFLCLGLAGVLPIMVSVKQRDYYMLTALPFFALAFGHMALSMTNACLSKIKLAGHKWMTLCATFAILIGFAMNATKAGQYGRDEAFLVEMKKALVEIPENEVISVSSENIEQWLWHAYFMRYGKVSLDDKEAHKYSFSYPPQP